MRPLISERMKNGNKWKMHGKGKNNNECELQINWTQWAYLGSETKYEWVNER